MITLVAIILVAVVFAAVLIPLMMLRGFVLCKLWLWFIVPLGLHPISYVHAMGISIIIGMLTENANAATKDHDKPIMGILTPFIAILLAWGVGAIVHSFM